MRWASLPGVFAAAASRASQFVPLESGARAALAFCERVSLRSCRAPGCGAARQRSLMVTSFEALAPPHSVRPRCARRGSKRFINLPRQLRPDSVAPPRGGTPRPLPASLKPTAPSLSNQQQCNPTVPSGRPSRLHSSTPITHHQHTITTPLPSDPADQRHQHIYQRPPQNVSHEEGDAAPAPHGGAAPRPRLHVSFGAWCGVVSAKGSSRVH